MGASGQSSRGDSSLLHLPLDILTKIRPVKPAPVKGVGGGERALLLARVSARVSEANRGHTGEPRLSGTDHAWPHAKHAGPEPWPAYPAIAQAAPGPL